MTFLCTMHFLQTSGKCRRPHEPNKNEPNQEMSTSGNLTTGFSDSKSHYAILDGLRGVAAVIVVAFHILETFSGGDHTKQIINHGYLAVDFFFVLSGFVIGYAYDDRWHKMSLKDFFKRRLIRLHPMIIAGMIIGALLFYFQSGPAFPPVANTPVWEMLLVMIIGFTLLPVGHSLDIRGWTEMHPLNGPAWTLFFEYIANLLYALFIKKFSNTMLAIFVFVAGCALIHMSVTSPNGDIIGGWSVDPAQLRIGFTRLLYPFFAGLLLSRIAKPRKIKHSFLWCSLMLVALLAMPRVGGSEHLWQNGIYDSLVIIFIFPLIVYIGISSHNESSITAKASSFLGLISYPLYITHYPIMYVYMTWVAKHPEYVSGPSAAPWLVVLVSVATLASSILVAYVCVQFYDIPARRWLTQRFIFGSSENAVKKAYAKAK